MSDQSVIPDGAAPGVPNGRGAVRALYALLVPLAAVSVVLLLVFFRYQQARSQFLVERADVGLESSRRQLLAYLDEAAETANGRDGTSQGSWTRFTVSNHEVCVDDAGAAPVLRVCKGEAGGCSGETCRDSPLRSLRDTVPVPALAGDLLPVD